MGVIPQAMKPGRTPKGTQPEPILYYEHLLIAFVRGRTGDTTITTLDDALAAVDLYGWTRDVNKFHRKAILPRVQRVIDIIQSHLPPGRTPTSLVDVGCGRGTALWPMMEAFPHTPFTGIDAYEGRAADIHSMKAAGMIQFSMPYCREAEDLHGIGANNWDVGTILEVLEHVQDPEKAAKEMVRVCRREVVFSVPSVKDWNPDHLRLYTEGTLRNLWLQAGAKRVEIFTDVPKHFVGIAHLS